MANEDENLINLPDGGDSVATDLNTTHRGSDGSDHSKIGVNESNITLNTNHRGSDGSDHSKIGVNESAITLNTNHRGSDGSDHSKVTGMNLAVLTDTDMVSPVQGDIIRYNPSTSKYENFHFMETADRIINIDSGMSMATIQGLIDGIGKYIPYGVTITFQFADGTYNMGSTTLSLVDFFGGGGLCFYGNMGENEQVRHTDQAVHLDHSANDGHGIDIHGIKLRVVEFINLKISTKTDVEFYHVIGSWETWNVGIIGCYLICTSDAKGSSVFNHKGCTMVYQTYITKSYYGIYTRTGHIRSVNNADTGGQPKKGLTAFSGGLIAKEGTQPTGSQSNEYIANGGIIR